MEEYFEEMDCGVVGEEGIRGDCRYIDIEFDNFCHQGLSNKIIYLSGIVRYCQKHPRTRLVEPVFRIGVHHHTRDEDGILFSDIFDIAYFNKKLEGFFYMVPRDRIDPDRIEALPHHYANEYGWDVEHDEYIYRMAARDEITVHDNVLLRVLGALRLNRENREILRKELMILGKKYNAIHIRNESDWPDDWVKMSTYRIVRMYRESGLDGGGMLFFSTGESHHRVSRLLDKNGIRNRTFSDDEMKYDLKTAIAFAVCLFSDVFISHTYSTFSSLIVMQRELMLRKRRNYSYNHTRIYRRVDRGLHYKKNIESGKDASTPVRIIPKKKFS